MKILSLITVNLIYFFTSSLVAQDYPYNLQKNGIELPYVTDSFLYEILDSKNTIYYKLPMVWQHYNVNPAVWKRFYFSDHLNFFNANTFFPWETTFGLNDAKKNNLNIYKTINFINLPSKKDGSPFPILILNEKPVKWIFPAGTTVGEIIYVEYKNKKYVQEIRIRTKNKECTTWEPNIYRPIKDKDEFCKIIGISNTYVPGYLYEFFRNPQEDEVFQIDGLIERLPNLTDEQVIKLLSVPFKNIKNGDETWSPASDKDFHILPKNYSFSLLGSVDSVSCSNCHKQTQISVKNLIPKEPEIINNPKKVGNIRGCDGVFTWYPINNLSIRKSNNEKLPRLYLRSYDLKNKYVDQLLSTEKLVDPENRYKLTLFVQESLKNYELPTRKEVLHNR